MVVVFSFDAFAHDELLAGRLASNPGIPMSSVVGSLGLSALASALSVKALQWLSRGKSLVSLIRRILYQFVDSNTGGRVGVVETTLSCV